MGGGLLLGVGDEASLVSRRWEPLESHAKQVGFSRSWAFVLTAFSAGFCEDVVVSLEHCFASVLESFVSRKARPCCYTSHFMSCVSFDLIDACHQCYIALVTSFLLHQTAYFLSKVICNFNT